jgi:hypothetical protein
LIENIDKGIVPNGATSSQNNLAQIHRIKLLRKTILDSTKVS